MKQNANKKHKFEFVYLRKNKILHYIKINKCITSSKLKKTNNDYSQQMNFIFITYLPTV